MQFGGKAQQAQRRRNRRLLLSTDISESYYPHGLSMYSDPPTMNITLQEFETYAYDRVKVLHYLDTLAVSAVKHSAAYNEKLTEFLRKNYQGFLLPTSTERDVSEAEIEWRKRDHISHFILRLAYCRSEDLRHWFLEKELDLFRFRFLREGLNSIQSFLRLNNLTYNPISDEEKEQFSFHLSKITADMNEAAIEKSLFYRVPFQEVLNLVSSRRVFLSEGDAFVPQREFLSIISTRFRENLSKALALTSRSLPQLEEEDRLLPILQSFNQNAVSTAYDPKRNEGNVSINDLDELSKSSYPLCMRQLHQQLKESHHLRHFGRMQYGLFLKGIGVTLEDSLKFWRREMGKGIGEDKFDKEHAYNVRHNYGKEGKRTNYTPYSCMTIITKNPPSGIDHHGCPFKHTSPDLLRQRLRSYKTPSDAVDQIIDLVKGQHFQIACQKYFAVTHKLEEDAVLVTHPNQYFDESQLILTGGKPSKSSGAKSNRDDNNFVPAWSAPIQRKQSTDGAGPVQDGGGSGPVPAAVVGEHNSWDDDSNLERMMMDYAEQT